MSEYFILCCPRSDRKLPNVIKAYNDKMYFCIDDAIEAQKHYPESRIFKVHAEVVSDFTDDEMNENKVLNRFRTLQRSVADVIDSMDRINHHTSHGRLDKAQHERESFLYDRIERLRKVHNETQ